MPRKWDFDAFGEKSFAAPLAAPGESCAPAFGAHPGTKTVLLPAGSFGSL